VQPGCQQFSSYISPYVIIRAAYTMGLEANIVVDTFA